MVPSLKCSVQFSRPWEKSLFGILIVCGGDGVQDEDGDTGNVAEIRGYDDAVVDVVVVKVDGGGDNELVGRSDVEVIEVIEDWLTDAEDSNAGVEAMKTAEIVEDANHSDVADDGIAALGLLNTEVVDVSTDVGSGLSELEETDAKTDDVTDGDSGLGVEMNTILLLELEGATTNSDKLVGNDIEPDEAVLAASSLALRECTTKVDDGLALDAIWVVDDA
jgi:hypothetical protein